jgi:hypothetical protein
VAVTAFRESEEVREEQEGDEQADDKYRASPVVEVRGAGDALPVGHGVRAAVTPAAALGLRGTRGRPAAEVPLRLGP